MTRRRSNDEGTVSQDRRTGLWVARLPAPWTPKPSGFTTKAAAIGWIRDQLSLADQGPLPHGDRTPLGEYLDYWLRQVRLKPKTLLSYQGIVDRYIKPVLGDVQLRDLEPYHIQELYTRLRERGLPRAGERRRTARPLSDATLHQVHRTLRRAASRAGLALHRARPDSRSRSATARQAPRGVLDARACDPLPQCRRGAPVVSALRGGVLHRGALRGDSWPAVAGHRL